MSAERRIVSPDYFAAMQIRILDGELCRRPVGAAAATQVMVNRNREPPRLKPKRWQTTGWS